LLGALIPIFNSTPYQLAGIDLFLATGFIATISYVLYLGIPLIIVWIFNIGILIRVRKQNRKRTASRRKNTNASTTNFRSERLSKDLSYINETMHLQTENGAHFSFSVNQSNTPHR